MASQNILATAASADLLSSADGERRTAIVARYLGKIVMATLGDRRSIGAARRLLLVARRSSLAIWEPRRAYRTSLLPYLVYLLTGLKTMF